MQHNLDTTQPYPGIMSLLQELHDEGKNIAVVSNKFYAATRELCRHFFGDLVPVAIGEREDIRKKPAPDSVKKQQTPDTAKKAEHSNTEGKTNEETDTPAVDMHKKVMRGSYKVTGYRVQAYAGGNSRNDRLKAERIGNAIKMRYPDQPVYVHFYSPRWICRVGNFRSLEEARKMLAKVKAMGYRQACLVKGKITVQY